MCKKVTVVSFFLLVAVFCICLFVMQGISSLKDGIILINDKSYLRDISSQNGKVSYKCVLTIKNQTDKNRKCHIKAKQYLEYILGSIASPTMNGIDETTGSSEIVLAPNDEKTFYISFVAQRGRGPLLKADRNIPRVLLVPIEDNIT